MKLLLLSYNGDCLKVFINILKCSYKKKQVINEVTKNYIYTLLINKL